MQSHPHPAPHRAWVRIPNPGSGTQGPRSGITDPKGTPPPNHKKGTDPDQDKNLRSGSGYPSLTTGFNTYPAGSGPIRIRIRVITYRTGTRIPTRSKNVYSSEFGSAQVRIGKKFYRFGIRILTSDGRLEQYRSGSVPNRIRIRDINTSVRIRIRVRTRKISINRIRIIIQIKNIRSGYMP
jgi:hypothetical protein